MRRLFLLRAYGDFVIAIRAILFSPQPYDTKIIASLHFKPLFDALNRVLDMSPLDIEFHDFGIDQTQLNFFTNRHLANTNTYTQIKKVKKYIDEQAVIMGDNFFEDYVEQSSRIKWFQFFTKHSFIPIVKKAKVYNEYTRFFNSTFKEIEVKVQPEGKILILPDARIQKRNLPQELVQEIISLSNQKNYQVQVAYFKRVSQVNKNGKAGTVQFKTDLIFSQKVYNNFTELIELIQFADFVIGADSLPIHLSNLFNKPHFILYPNVVSKAFFTPFAIQHKYYSEFDKYEQDSIPFLS
jgi:Glycosyltransferase family 9 (heptosyltransferase)